MSEQHLDVEQRHPAGVTRARGRRPTHILTAPWVWDDRYQAIVTGTLPNAGGWAVGACSSYGVVTQFGANALLNRSAQGF